MRRGNFYGLPVSLTFFTFLSLFTTAGAYIVLQGGEGEPLTNPAEIVGLVGNVFLTIIAAITFVIATIGINLVANFIPPAYDLSNLNPQRISFKTGGYLTAALGFIVGALWVATISQIGLPMFVDTLGAILAPLYGVLVADYYIVQRRSIKVADLFSMDEGGRYFYQRGWNMRALIAIGIAAIFSIAAVWVPALHWTERLRLGDRRPARSGAVHRGDVVVPAEGRCSGCRRRRTRRADRRRSASLNGGQAPRHPRRKDLPRRVLPARGGRDRRRAHRRCRRSPRPSPRRAHGARSRRRRPAAGARRLARARQRAGPHGVGGLPLGDPRRRGRRRDDDRRHAAELAAADDDGRGARDQAGGGGTVGVRRRRLLGRRGARQPRRARTAARGRRLRLQVLPLAVGRRRVPASRPRAAARPRWRRSPRLGSRLIVHAEDPALLARRTARSAAGTTRSSPRGRPRARHPRSTR